MQKIKISRSELIARKLKLTDNLQSYLHWITYPNKNKFLILVKDNYSLNKLQKLIESYNLKACTILIRSSNKQLYGQFVNIKYEYVDLVKKN